ncbi:TVP38/TMEM64 family protein [Nocardia arizonensis]|uniref:TVP38/TMEM64 family protein n=1 Tax=Nocardia arizonensis TaxID=1141647 RepID=UPI000A556F18|nr:TVP38/TMEM64 family protein [Nocardia arizonensis]
MTRLIRNRHIVALLLGVGVVVTAMLLPLPGPSRIQEWAGSAGPWLPLVFFVVYTIAATAPIPRTVLTVSCGVLFGPIPGSAVALSATTAAAALALLLVRALDRDQIAARLTHPAVRAIDYRLERRGWLAVGSLRLISFAPFSIVNYCCGLSSVRFWPYLVASLAGSLPGTVATVILADALTGGTDPAMIAVSATCIAFGLLGLAVDARWSPRAPEEPMATAAPPS